LSNHVPSTLEDKVRELEAAQKALAKVDDKRLREKILDVQARGEARAQGWLGHVFGDRSHAPIYIAGVIALGMAAIIICVVLLRSDQLLATETIQILGPFLTLALGYLFGKVT